MDNSAVRPKRKTPQTAQHRRTRRQDPAGLVGNTPASSPGSADAAPAEEMEFSAAAPVVSLPAIAPPATEQQTKREPRRFPPEPLTQAEVRSLLNACSNKSPTGIRNRALIVVFWRCGLRLKEVLALLPKDLDLEAGTIRVLHGKGDKSRLVGIDPEAAAVIQRWLDRRGEFASPRQPVFCTLKGGRLKPVYCRNLLHRLAEAAGVLKRVHPHGLRHTHAFELANEGHPIHLIQQQLGHSSLATTDRYIRHLNPQQVVEVMRGREWGREGARE